MRIPFESALSASAITASPQSPRPESSPSSPTKPVYFSLAAKILIRPDVRQADESVACVVCGQPYVYACVDGGTACLQVEVAARGDEKRVGVDVCSYKRKSKILEESIRFVSLYIITNSTTVGFFQMR